MVFRRKAFCYELRFLPTDQLHRFGGYFFHFASLGNANNNFTESSQAKQCALNIPRIISHSDAAERTFSNDKPIGWRCFWSWKSIWFLFFSSPLFAVSIILSFSMRACAHLQIPLIQRLVFFCAALCLYLIFCIHLRQEWLKHLTFQSVSHWNILMISL